MKKKITLRDGIRIEHLWALAVLVGIFVFVNTHPIQPYDFWFHIATGRETIQTGRIPEQDTFSYTAFGYPYPSNNIYWLAQIFLFGVYETGGPAWVILISSLVCSLSAQPGENTTEPDSQAQPDQPSSIAESPLEPDIPSGTS